MSAELSAALTALAAVMADFRAEMTLAPPELRDWMLRFLATLEELRAILGDEADDEDEAEEDARRLNAIRDLLAGFDWATGDPQRALEEIGRIAQGGQP